MGKFKTMFFAAIGFIGGILSAIFLFKKLEKPQTVIHNNVENKTG